MEKSLINLGKDTVEHGKHGFFLNLNFKYTNLYRLQISTFAPNHKKFNLFLIFLKPHGLKNVGDGSPWVLLGFYGVFVFRNSINVLILVSNVDIFAPSAVEGGIYLTKKVQKSGRKR